MAFLGVARLVVEAP